MRGEPERNVPNRSPVEHDRCTRQLETLERLLQIAAGDIETALSSATDLVAERMGADKVDAFLYKAEKDTLVAVGSSHQPLSAVQKQHGLDLLPVSNGGRVVHVFKSNAPFLTGDLLNDPEELRGVKEVLRLQSKLGVPLRVGGAVRGVLMIASQKPDRWDEDDRRHAEAIGRWVSLVLHRAELVTQLTRNATEQGRKAGAEEIVTILAHDIRNHLAPIHMRLTLVQKLARRDGRTSEASHMDQSIRGLDRLAALVGDILDISRLDRGMFDLAPETTDLAALIRDAASVLSTPDQPIIVQVRADAAIFVNADASRLRQVVENLLANAVKHSPTSAPVHVQINRVSQTDGERAVVEVIDQGPGVPDEVLPRIFDRYVSGEAKRGGLGLGLYLAKRIARLHGGDLQVENLPGKGARFTLAIPCCVPSPTAQAGIGDASDEGPTRDTHH